MPLIDGTYEILDQRPTGDGRTLVHGTDPDGRPVRIVWFDLHPEAEPSFERYRRTLRQLAREPDVLLRTVVSRPGARYAVWEDAGDAVPVPSDAAWSQRLASLDLDPTTADLRRQGRHTVLAGLDWSVDGDHPDTGAGPDGATTSLRAGRGGRTGVRRLVEGRIPPLGPTVRSWLAGTTLALLAVVLIAAGWLRYENSRTVAVPDLVGGNADVAARRLNQSGFEVIAQPLASSGPAGTVVATDPPAGTPLRPGRSVRLDYVRPRDGFATQEAPALVGRDVGAAESRLSEAGATVGTVARIPAGLPAGTVLAQRPIAGVRLAASATVDLLVSAGPSPRSSFLPDLVGLELADARELARLAGLPADRVLIDRISAGGVPAGRVVGMTPAAFHPLRIDDVTVRLLVSDPNAGVGLNGEVAPEAAGAPDLVGLPLEEARSMLTAKGVTVTVARTVDRNLPEAVVSQQPAPGAPLAETVRLLVNLWPREIPPPQPQLRIVEPRLRWVPYRFLIEPGIPQQRAELLAKTVTGDTSMVLRRQVQGGDVLEGAWLTATAGAVVFELRLNGLPYAESRVTGEVDGP